jgi:MFS family permease
LVLMGLFVWHSLRVARPLIDTRLFGSREFRAASTTTFVLGAALFGTLLILPLYYQVARGASALDAGLLLAPQGIGAALMLPISGRLTDRLGGGRVALAGCSVAALATLPLAFVSDHTPYLLLGGVLFVRGLGLGASVQPTTAAAYAALSSGQVPGATAALNTLRQIGGSIGTALLAMALQHQSAAAGAGPSGLLAPLTAGDRGRIGEAIGTAFGHTFAWSAALTAAALLPGVALVRAERVTRRTPTPAAVQSARPAG